MKLPKKRPPFAALLLLLFAPGPAFLGCEVSEAEVRESKDSTENSSEHGAAAASTEVTDEAPWMTVSYEEFDPSAVEVPVPPELSGYREPFEEENPHITRQGGWTTPARGEKLAVAARDPVAARVGFRVLEAGGNAADAAFAVGAAISVREPWFSHMLGGGTWALYRESLSGDVLAVDGAGTVGSEADPAFFRNPDNLREHGMEWSIVPGAWDAWMVWLEELGTMELDDLLAPAVDLAENGVAASRTMVGWITMQEASIASRPATASIFLPDGEAPAVGETIYQRELAKTLKMIIAAYRGSRPDGRSAAFQAARDVYYRGPIGEAISTFSLENRGSLTAGDFAGYAAELREPLKSDFQEWRLYNPPPNSQGIVMPMALNIIETFDLSTESWNDPETIHIVAEAMNLAHIDKHYYVGDPEHVDIPLKTLLSDQYAEAQAGRIAEDEAIRWPVPGGLEANEGFTTTFSVVDGAGNGAAITTSVGAQFVVAGKTGILMNQRLQNVFYEDQQNPNYLVPGRRVRHTVNPYIAVLPGKRVVFGGNTGYDTQPQGQIQQFLQLAQFGANPQEAVSRPRYIVHSFPDITYPHEVRNELALERGFDDTVAAALAAKGHSVSRGAIFGNGNVVVIDLESREVSAGADPRGENLALAR